MLVRSVKDAEESVDPIDQSGRFESHYVEARHQELPIHRDRPFVAIAIVVMVDPTGEAELRGRKFRTELSNIGFEGIASYVVVMRVDPKAILADRQVEMAADLLEVAFIPHAQVMLQDFGKIGGRFVHIRLHRACCETIVN
jgi:hypothetical protein